MDIKIIMKLGLKQFDSVSIFIFEDNYFCAESKKYIIFERYMKIFKIEKHILLDMTIEDLRTLLESNLKIET